MCMLVVHVRGMFMHVLHFIMRMNMAVFPLKTIVMLVRVMAILVLVPMLMGDLFMKMNVLGVRQRRNKHRRS